MKIKKEGMTLIELIIAILIAILIASIVIGAIVSLFLVINRFIIDTSRLTNVKEITKTGITALDWLFERWGVGVPCTDNATCTSIVTDVTQCGSYPPASSLCIIIKEGTPCDEVTFYGSLGGIGVVKDYVSENKVEVISCRLREDDYYHIKRSGNWIEDDSNVLAFKISGLAQENLYCGSEDNITQMDANVTAGNYTLTLLPGDILVRVPHKIRLFCKENPDDKKLYLYMERVDMGNKTSNKTSEYPLFPVEEFKVANDPEEDQYVKLEIKYEIENGTYTTIERIFRR